MEPIREIKRTRKKTCYECGIGFEDNGLNNNWTQCAYCYWKKRLEEHRPISEVLAERSRLKGECTRIRTDLAVISQDQSRHLDFLTQKAPWWKKLLRLSIEDREFRLLKQAKSRLEGEVSLLCCRIDGINKEIKQTKYCPKRFSSAIRVLNSLRRKQEEGKAFRQGCANEEQNQDFNRSRFRIHKKDYKRGNRVDNYFRRQLAEDVLAAFDDRCLFCGGKNDLTFDHYAIPKNEGGNFVLFVKESGLLKMNLVILCRYCNSMKGERSHEDFFDEDMRATVIRCHERVMSLILGDSDFLGILKKW